MVRCPARRRQPARLRIIQNRPGLAQLFSAEGWRTIAFDFRGHGESTLREGARDWGYDDLVRWDLPAVVACARARSDHKPVVVVGHSLLGRVALTVERIDEELEEEAWAWLRVHDERPYSFVDATSFALMRKQRVADALAFDGDFAAAGLNELRA